MKKETGFTAVELVVVIAVIGILAAVSIPGFISWRSNAKLRGTTNNLKADLEMAKLKAIRENDFVAILFAAGGNGYTVFIDNGAGGGIAGDWTPNGTEQILKNIQLPAGVTITIPTTFAGNQTRFNGRGIPGNLGSVSIVGQTGNRQITINSLGRIRVQ
ncbi:MAG: hypothetical protein A2V65_07870 [Deltaproteobacteria bacterium RBG_13_49_15]|nr:MAG: hypothetical protein A2V65_07870 [Deltaproteobacteria bacterium RBG_13_49_15]